jgi:hypothetical protein
METFSRRPARFAKASPKCRKRVAGFVDDILPDHSPSGNQNDSSAAFIFAGSDFVNVMEAQTESGVVARMMSSRSLAKPSRSQTLPRLCQAQAK